MLPDLSANVILCLTDLLGPIDTCRLRQVSRSLRDTVDQYWCLHTLRIPSRLTDCWIAFSSVNDAISSSAEISPRDDKENDGPSGASNVIETSEMSGYSEVNSGGPRRSEAPLPRCWWLGGGFNCVHNNFGARALRHTASPVFDPQGAAMHSHTERLIRPPHPCMTFRSDADSPTCPRIQAWFRRGLERPGAIRTIVCDEVPVRYNSDAVGAHELDVQVIRDGYVVTRGKGGPRPVEATMQGTAQLCASFAASCGSMNTALPSSSLFIHFVDVLALWLYPPVFRGVTRLVLNPERMTHLICPSQLYSSSNTTGKKARKKVSSKWHEECWRVWADSQCAPWLSAVADIISPLERLELGSIGGRLAFWLMHEVLQVCLPNLKELVLMFGSESDWKLPTFAINTDLCPNVEDVLLLDIPADSVMAQLGSLLKLRTIRFSYSGPGYSVKREHLLRVLRTNMDRGRFAALRIIIDGSVHFADSGLTQQPEAFPIPWLFPHRVARTAGVTEAELIGASRVVIEGDALLRPLRLTGLREFGLRVLSDKQIVDLKDWSIEGENDAAEVNDAEAAVGRTVSLQKVGIKFLSVTRISDALKYITQLRQSNQQLKQVKEWGLTNAVIEGGWRPSF